MSLYTERDGAGERTYAPSELAEELTHDEMLTLAGFIVMHVAEALGGGRLDDVVDVLGEEAQALRDGADDDLDLAAVCEGSDDEGNVLYIVDCQVCGLIVDTVNEADYEDAASYARDLCTDHNAATHHNRKERS